MKRVVHAVLVSFILLGMVGIMPVFAHGGITVDGSDTDWAAFGTGSCPALPASNSGSSLDGIHVDCGLGLNGGTEWVWTDASGDERTDFATPDSRVDITQFRVTADATNIYFLIRMTDISQATGNGAPMIQIAVDTTQSAGDGTLNLAGNSTAMVGIDAAWEHLLFTRFGSGIAGVGVYDEGFASLQTTGSAAISMENDLIELSIPWSALSASSGPGDTLRFTVSTHRTNAADNVWYTMGGASGNSILDAITTVAGNTWSEVSDSDIDYYFDIASSPTAVTLNGLRSSQTLPIVGMVILAGGLGTLWFIRRKR